MKVFELGCCAVLFLSAASHSNGQSTSEITHFWLAKSCRATSKMTLSFDLGPIDNDFPGCSSQISVILVGSL